MPIAAPKWQFLTELEKINRKYDTETLSKVTSDPEGTKKSFHISGHLVLQHRKKNSRSERAIHKLNSGMLVIHVSYNEFLHHLCSLVMYRSG